MDIPNSYTTLNFDSLNKGEWLRTIALIRNGYEVNGYKKFIILMFNSHFRSEDFEPIHFVTLACLIQFLDQKGHQVAIASGNDEVRNMLFTDLRIQEYWSGGQNHVDSTSSNIFNLWRIIEAEKDLYAKNVEQYFKNNFFKGKDLSVISLSMVEAYYNVFDHADAGGNAFSLIKYDVDNEILHVAICDFGKGISKSVRDFSPEISNDKDALLKSIEVDFTVGSKEHNKGKGLDNILSCSSVVRIFCNNALLLKSETGIKMFDVDFHLGGTLIYFQIPLLLVEDEEILDEFTL
ncbi:ATP-binding protein [Bacteroides salyersiae]|uniref:ATP-binding protein n=1 Tax=Bacteroides salyersiae TaxID=291644 RepID=UPI001E45AFD2|nr:ATP-binding protein [Bacteroides salyersiae]